MAYLKKQRTYPCPLPIDQTSDMVIGIYKYVWCMKITVPQGRPEQLFVVWQKCVAHAQELFVQRDVSFGRSLRLGRSNDVMQWPICGMTTDPCNLSLGDCA